MQKYDASIQQKLSIFLSQYREISNAAINHSPGMLFLKRIGTRLVLLMPELKSRVQDRIKKIYFEFPDRKFDIGDWVAVEVNRAANSMCKFARILNRDSSFHYLSMYKEP